MKKIYSIACILIVCLQFSVFITADAQAVNLNGNIYYVRQALPWGQPQADVLDAAFGVGNYTVSDYSIAPGTLLSNSTAIIYLEGSDGLNPSALSNFLNTNRAALEDWVYRGGRLFLNAAPNEGGNIDFGFGGVLLNYPSFTGWLSPVNIAVGQNTHQVFTTPNSSIGSSWTGGYFGHGTITGGSATSLIIGNNDNNVASTVLAEKKYGSGLVIFGGMTTANFHQPQPAATNLRINILNYLKSFVGVPINAVSTSIGTTSFCANTSLSVNYTVTGTYNAGNTFTAQLSDASGSFASPTDIGSLSSTTSGSINATIPAGTASGTGYRIRVISSDPAVTGTDNGSNITIKPLTTFTTAVTNVTCPGGTNGSIKVTATSAGTTFNWTNPTLIDAGSGDVYNFNSASHATPVTSSVSSLSIGNTSANIHSHSGSPVSFTIDLFNASTSSWVTVYSSSTVSEFYFQNFNISFPAVAQVSQIRFTSSPGQNQSYHFFSMPITLNPVRYSKDGGASFQFSDIFNNLMADTYQIVVDDGVNCVSAVQEVTVLQEDKDAPVPTVATLSDVTDECSVTLTAPTAMDNCAGIIVGTTTDPFTYSTKGSYTITWTYDDGNGNSSTQTQKVIINDVTPPTITAPADMLSVKADAGKCYATIASLGAPVTNDNCGVDVETISNDAPATFPIGTTFVQWTVKDVTGNTSLVATQTVTVSDDQKPVITHNGNKNLSNDAGKCGATVAVSASATDNCSVGTPTGVRSDGKPLTDLFPVGTTTITWNVTDANGNAATEVIQTVTVSNTAPAINTITAPVDPIAINTTVNLSIGFTDNNVTSAVIDWGNGTTTAGTVNSVASTVTASYAYTAAGVYRIKCILTDACSAVSQEAIYEYIVVYDPSAGFVTGGGWINSPAGAYAPDPALTGKANFGFVSKYEKGATVPKGNTEFQFHAGNLNFKSAVYEWLVVAGYKAQYKGSGTINGSGEYGFMLSAVDGQLTGGGVDKFRIKIWNKATGSTVYDNQMGAADDAVASTAIDGGSIVIHTPKSSKSESFITDRSQVQELQPTAKLGLSAMPNPSRDYFQLTLQGATDKTANLRVVDVLGRVVEVKRNIAANGVLRIGESYRSGVYIVELQQGAERVMLKLLKGMN